MAEAPTRTLADSCLRRSARDPPDQFGQVCIAEARGEAVPGHDVLGRLQAEELLEYRFVPAAELDAYVGPGFAGRLRRALEARKTGEVVELSSTSWG